MIDPKKVAEHIEERYRKNKIIDGILSCTVIIIGIIIIILLTIRN